MGVEGGVKSTIGAGAVVAVVVRRVVGVDVGGGLGLVGGALCGQGCRRPKPQGRGRWLKGARSLAGGALVVVRRGVGLVVAVVVVVGVGAGGQGIRNGRPQKLGMCPVARSMTGGALVVVKRVVDAVGAGLGVAGVVLGGQGGRNGK